MAEFFRRVEKKYILNKSQYLFIKEQIDKYMVEDIHGKSTICNVYFDSPNYDLIRHSITKPIYKDKVRIRSYNTPQKDDMVFLEVKRKYQEVVSKRRIAIKLEAFYEYLKNSVNIADDKSQKQIAINSKGTYKHTGSTNLTNERSEEQIAKELNYYFKYYKLEPKMYVSYYRRAYYDKENMDFRLTFDSNILAREDDLQLEFGSYGSLILEKDKYVMEIKTIGAIPLWFVKLLDHMNVSPCGFSKYGEAYTQIKLKANNIEKCVI